MVKGSVHVSSSFIAPCPPPRCELPGQAAANSRGRLHAGQGCGAGQGGLPAAGKPARRSSSGFPSTHWHRRAGIPDALHTALLLVLAEPRKSTQLLLNPRGAARCCAVLQYSINGKTPWQQCKQPPGANFLLSAVRGGCEQV